MNLTLVALDRPTPDFAAVFTRNAFPGAPVIIGRRRLDEATVGALVVNNKVSIVCAPDGVAIAERWCEAVAGALGLQGRQVLPNSTGVIGWRMPVEAMLAALPDAVASLGQRSLLDAATAIMTTDLYPKVRRASVGRGSIVGFAKGAGMIEPNLATMLVFLLTDVAIPRAELRRMLVPAVDCSFNCMSIDSDTSTSDTVLLLSSGALPCPDPAAFERALAQVCQDLAEDWSATARASTTSCAFGSVARPTRPWPAAWASQWSTRPSSSARCAAMTRTWAAWRVPSASTSAWPRPTWICATCAFAWAGCRSSKRQLPSRCQARSRPGRPP